MNKSVIMKSHILSDFSAYAIYIILTLVCLILIYAIYKLLKMSAERKKFTKDIEDRDEKINILELKLGNIEEDYNKVCEHFEEMKTSKDKIAMLAYTDLLTNLPNRYKIVEQMDSVYATIRKDEKFVLIHIDVDNFKEITDVIGHSYGDELLLDISYRLKEAMEPDDFLAKDSSDEFLIFCQNIGEIAEFEEKIKKLQKLFSYPFMVSSKEVAVSVSMGVAIGPEYGKNTAQLMTNASLAMYAAKEKGKNCYCYYDEEIGERISNEVLIQSEITQAFANDEFEAYFQPVTDFDDNIICYEALVRWNRPDGEVYTPDKFLDIAYKTGQIVEIDEAMILKACEFIAEKNIPVSVNVSGKYMLAGSFVSSINSILSDTKVIGNMLYLEVKEKCVSADMDSYSEVIKKLDSIGVNICVDNFGVGVGSVNLICVLPVNMVKIDKSVLDGAMFDEEYMNLVKTISYACSLSGIKCVAEGVEAVEQKQFVKDMNCQAIQGFLAGKPEKFEI